MRRVGVDQEVVFVRRRPGSGIGQGGACLGERRALILNGGPPGGLQLSGSILARAFGPQVTSRHRPTLHRRQARCAMASGSAARADSHGTIILRLSSSITALATPFNAAGDIDFDAWHQLLAQQLEGGTHAIVVAGSTGEAAALTDGEYDALLKSTVDYV